MSESVKNRHSAELTDDVLAKLTDAFYEAREIEGWSARDVAGILACSETQISHILNGRRKNLTLASIATLARALRKRPEFTLVDVRPKGNGMPEQQDFASVEPPVRGRTSATSNATIKTDNFAIEIVR